MKLVSREEREQYGVPVDQSEADPEVQVTKVTFMSRVFENPEEM